MAHTNATPNYALPQFISTDKPAWLTDVNSGFAAIDTAIKGASDAAAAVDTKVGTLSSLTTDVKTSVVSAINSLNEVDTYTDPQANYIVKKAGHVIYLRLSGQFDYTAGSWNTLFQLPEEFRPSENAYNVIYDTSSNNESDMFKRGQITTGGNVQLYSTTSHTGRNLRAEFMYII